MNTDSTEYEYKGFRIRLGAISQSDGYRPVADFPIYVRGDSGIKRVHPASSRVGTYNWALRDARRLAITWIDDNPSAKPYGDYPPPINESG